MWFETTSFIAFESISSIDGLAYKFKATIAPSKDLFLLRLMDLRSARLCGRFYDQTILAGHALSRSRLIEETA